MLYTEICDNIPGLGCSIDDWNTTYQGCECTTNKCDQLNDCSCLHHLKQNNYVRSQNNDHVFNLNLDQPINECHLECKCIGCSNRLVQNGPKFNLEVFETLNKGKGLRSTQLIPKGSFVIEYLGELLGSKEAEVLLEERKNEPNNYIMFLREFYSFDNSFKTIIIDAKNYSNKARFINHSCEPNLVVVPVRIDNIIPHAALFALRDIIPLEELSYNYNQSENRNTDNIQLNSNLKQCLCGSSNCKGYLPNSK